ncbi:DNA mismatch repair protein [Candidatus Saccharibacteria bacterium]|nr:DNA mismatch repair protein [Candidatus Saccharibacteria bacterium]
MSQSRDYDIASAESIAEYAKALHNKKLSDIVSLPENAYKSSNKGGLGSMVEEYFFEYKPGANQNHDPDFTEAGVELKVTGVLRQTPTVINPAPYKAKERLVLTMISYIALANEEWNASSFLKKCRTMLILFYLYQKEVPISELEFVLPPLLWEFTSKDLEIIEKDWRAIRQKVLDGKAHEISEGDTFYLAACRKGSGGAKEKLREQPYSHVPAKARAFSLKPTYVNTMIASAWNQNIEDELIRTEADAERGIEQVALGKFGNLRGLSVNELAQIYGMQGQNLRSKSYFYSLTMRILGSKKKYIPEFEKAGIVIKTIRLRQNGTPKESMSFPAFKFQEIAEQEWEESELYDKLNQKFLFVIFRYDNEDVLRFEKVMFWNMPYADRESAYQAWDRTKQAIVESRIERFPKISNSPVIHVRPHGKNSDDVLPFPDGSLHTKQCFWLNAKYIASQISP